MNLFKRFFHKMSAKEKNIKTTTKWFRRKKKVEFSLPDGHFGRPHDCSYALERVYYYSSDFVIELDTRKQFVFKGGVTIQIVDDNLEISGFTKFSSSL